MNPRTIVLSLGAHVVVIAVLVAIKSAPEPRAPTMIRITESKKAAPKSKAPKSKAPASKAPASKPAPKPKPKPKPRPKTRARTAKAQPKARTSPMPSGGSGRPAPRFSGLVLGNASGVGMAIDVPEDVARGPAIAASGDGSGGTLAAAIQPIEPTPPPTPKTARCTRIERPRIVARPHTIRYAEEARTAGAEGRLVVRLHISARGRVTRTTVVKPVHPALDREAIAAARTWRFEPERRCGRPVASTFVIARRFELTD